jgi:hypothetical protein
LPQITNFKIFYKDFDPASAANKPRLQRSNFEWFPRGNEFNIFRWRF